MVPENSGWGACAIVEGLIDLLLVQSVADADVHELSKPRDDQPVLPYCLMRLRMIVKLCISMNPLVRPELLLLSQAMAVHRSLRTSVLAFGRMER